ncbi:MAG: hypothetical protein JNG88_15045 [Phycisphaerales bacterium]|nr:hypothetical protein [Phycisphaerales bacterium]
MRGYYRSIKILATMVSAGVAFQTATCQPRALVNFGRNFNPCGTILNCDPVEYNFLTSGYQGPGVDLDTTLFCTFPPLCPNDPLLGAVNP